MLPFLNWVLVGFGLLCVGNRSIKFGHSHAARVVLLIASFTPILQSPSNLALETKLSEFETRRSAVSFNYRL